MDLVELVRALLTYDTLAARQWIVDAARTRLIWTDVPAPLGLDASGMAVAAGVVELQAERAGQRPPAWTAGVGPAPVPVLLVRAAATMPRLRRLCEEEGPEPLRRRRLLAPPDILTHA